MALLVIIGSIPSSRKASMDLGGLRFIDVYVPTMIAFVLAMLALISLPAVLAAYRERGILRRLSTTPVQPSWVLAAQLAINVAVVVITLSLIVGIGRVAFGVPCPRRSSGSCLPPPLPWRPCSLLASLWRRLLPAGRRPMSSGRSFLSDDVLRGSLGASGVDAGRTAPYQRLSPAGAAVQALQDTTRGNWPQPLHLAVMAVYALFSASLR